MPYLFKGPCYLFIIYSQNVILEGHWKQREEINFFLRNEFFKKDVIMGA